MKRAVLLLTAILFIFHALGCGGTSDKDINKDKDRPEAPKKKE
jgi:hypothetical protein